MTHLDSFVDDLVCRARLAELHDVFYKAEPILTEGHALILEGLHEEAETVVVLGHDLLVVPWDILVVIMILVLVLVL